MNAMKVLIILLVTVTEWKEVNGWSLDATGNLLQQRAPRKDRLSVRIHKRHVTSHYNPTRRSATKSSGTQLTSVLSDANAESWEGYPLLRPLFRIRLRKDTSLYDSDNDSLEKDRNNDRRSRRKWIIRLVTSVLLATVLSTIVFPIRSASAASVANDALLSAPSPSVTQTAASYSSNAAQTVLSLSRPMSMAAELHITARLVIAAALGAVLGKERSRSASSSNHQTAAGTRTMSLVSLGAAAFTICSMYGFANVGRHDPSRMASNVASGVGFVGAGVITTTTQDGESLVHGLTTAAAIWLSAAVGVASGAGLYYVASVGAALTIIVLRHGQLSEGLKRKVPIRPTKVRIRLKHRRERDEARKLSSQRSSSRKKNAASEFDSHHDDRHAHDTSDSITQDDQVKLRNRAHQGGNGKSHHEQELRRSGSNDEILFLQNRNEEEEFMVQQRRPDRKSDRNDLGGYSP